MKMKSLSVTPRLILGTPLLCAAFSAMIGCLPLSEGKAAMIMHLKLDEGSGTVAANSVPGGENGSLVGAGSGWTTDVPSNFASQAAYHNNGTNGAYIGLPATSVGELDDFTITGWINVHSAVGTTGGNDRILAKNNFSSSYFDLGFRNLAGGGMGIALDIQINGTTAMSAVLSSAIDFSDGWLFIAATRDGATGQINLYLGTPDAAGLSLIGNGNEVVGTIPSNVALLTLGNVQSNTARNGDVSYSDFRVYDTALAEDALEAIRLEQVPEPKAASLALVAGSTIALISLMKDRGKVGGK